MKIKFSLFNLILLFGSSYYIAFNMSQAGVPDAIIITFSMVYGYCFPWKVLSLIEQSEEGESKPDETDKSDNH